MEKFSFSDVLPFFPGFYNTELDAQGSEYDYAQTWAQEKNDKYNTDRFTPGMYTLNYDGYQDAVAAAYIEAFMESAPSIVEDISLNKIISPRFYNFKNDELDVTITLSDDWEEVMKGFMDSNQDWLTDRINKDWTSYDGFTSFMSEKFRDWYDKIFVEKDERYLSSMIAYMMYFENKRIREELNMWALENVCAWEYMSETEEAAALEDELRKPGWDMTNQLELEFSN